MPTSFTKAKEPLYVAMVKSRTETIGMFSRVDVWLVNDTDEQFTNVRTLSGAFTSMDEDLSETGKREGIFRRLQPNTSIQIGSTDTGEMDMVVWFNIDMTTASGETKLYKCWLPKQYRWRDFEVFEVTIDYDGIKSIEDWHILYLTERTDGSIDDYIAKYGLGARYLKNIDGKMVLVEYKADEEDTDEMLQLEEDLKLLYP
jgi:hypothetical protein